MEEHQEKTTKAGEKLSVCSKIVDHFQKYCSVHLQHNMDATDKLQRIETQPLGHKAHPKSCLSCVTLALLLLELHVELQLSVLQDAPYQHSQTTVQHGI